MRAFHFIDAVLAGLLMLASAGASAQPSPGAERPASPPLQVQPAETLVAPGGGPPARGLTAYASHSSLTGSFPDWREFGLRGFHEFGRHLLQGELATMKRWNESGAFLSLGDRYIITDDWYTFLSLGAGDGASYLPEYRIDGFLHRKLLAGRNLVANLGAGYYRAPDGHIDRNVSVGATYYAQTQPLVVQAEIRFTHGSPGGVDTRQHFVAATWGRVKGTTVTGRYGWGREAYQAIGRDAVLTDFRSREASVNVRHWLGDAWGLELAVQQYRNPFYRRNGVTAGVFWQP